jgi:hypothetical protein
MSNGYKLNGLDISQEQVVSSEKTICNPNLSPVDDQWIIGTKKLGLLCACLVLLTEISALCCGLLLFCYLWPLY